jgi:hypothetical protein
MNKVHASKRRLLPTVLICAIAAAAAMATAGHATTITESTDFSDDPAHPTVVTTPLTLGSNVISGTINTFGAVVGPHGERTNQDNDYITFTVSAGDVLSAFDVTSGTSIFTTANSPTDDNVFLGLYKNPYTPVDPSFTSATGLYGWTLVNESQIGSNILPKIGAATAPGFPVPGATGFTGALGAGTYTLWLVDGDENATYSFNAEVAPVPEPAAWTMMIVGFGIAGSALRRRPQAVGVRLA